MSFSEYELNPRTTPDTEAQEMLKSQSSGEVLGNYLAGLGIVLGIASLFYKPLLFGVFAAIFVTVGAVSSDGGKMTKAGMPIVVTCIVLGMLIAVFVTHRPVW